MLTGVLRGVADSSYRSASDGVRADLIRLGEGTERFGITDVRRGLRPFSLLCFAYGELAGVHSGGLSRCAGHIDGILDRAIERYGNELYGGWAGLGWMTTHLGDPLDAVGEAVDRRLVKALSDWSRHFGYDLISGLVGVGVHFVERLPKDLAHRGLRLILDQLERTATEVGDGIAWFTEPDLLPEWQRKRVPQGYYNLGVAHGVPGVMWLLGKLCVNGIEADRARALLEGSLRWLLAVHPDPATPDLPSWVGPGVRREPNRRMAWCYGPLGAAAVVWEAAREGHDSAGEEWARTLSLACAGVEPSESGNRDAALCHGAAGNGHIFHRLYRRTRDDRFRRAALAWFDNALAFRRPGVGIGGFRAWTEVDGGQGFVDDASFLSGSAGIGLALLGAITDTDPAWDRLLLLS